MLDVSESGRQIGEKLFAVLDTVQKKELAQYIIERDKRSGFEDSLNHVSNLRRKLRVEEDSPDYIKSVHSIGYKFVI